MKTTIKPTKDNIGRLWFELPTCGRVELDLPDWRNWTLWETRRGMKTHIMSHGYTGSMLVVGHDYRVQDDRITIRTEDRHPFIVAVPNIQPNIPLDCGHEVAPGSRFCSWCGTPAVISEFA